MRLRMRWKNFNFTKTACILHCFSPLFLAYKLSTSSVAGMGAASSIDNEFDEKQMITKEQAKRMAGVEWFDQT